MVINLEMSEHYSMKRVKIIGNEILYSLIHKLHCKKHANIL